MSPKVVSLIHGVRRLHRRHPNRRWMREFRAYLLEKGVASVSCFYWNGAILQGFRAKDAPSYADQLMEVYSHAREIGASFTIVAKSLGGVIAEKALILLGDRIRVDLLLRIGVPDHRIETQIPSVSRVINVVSHHDWLYRLGRLVAPYFIGDDLSDIGTASETIELVHLTHFTLTERTLLHQNNVRAETTYDLYWRLIAERLH